MDINQLKSKRRARRKRRVRKQVLGTSDAPRMSVYRSHRQIYVQLIDDLSATTVCEASSRNKAIRDSFAYGGNKAAASEIGKEIAERAKQKGVSKVVFDRNGYKFHGRVKALADAAREAGLKF